MIILQLFLSYLKIGFFGFGGGYAMLSLLQNEIVMQNEWLTNAQLADIIAISQMTPGPIAINSATYVGYTVAGFWGSVVATTAVCTPALTLMVVVTRYFLKLKHNTFINTFMQCMHPVVIGMIGAAILSLMFPMIGENDNFIDSWSWLFFGVTFFLSMKKVSLILLIFLSAIGGIAVYYLPSLFM
ncbi:MAG: chromate transporter [Rikenellaceae bacterium]